MPVVHLLAHQGGWDETIFVLLPLIVFAVLLVVARRRVDRMEAADDADRTSDPDEDARGA